MRTILARCLDSSTTQHIPTKAAVRVLQRRLRLTQGRAQLVLFDYLGESRDEISKTLHVLPESVDTYWKRVYHALGVTSRSQMHQRIEQVLAREFGDGAQR